MRVSRPSSAPSWASRRRHESRQQGVAGIDLARALDQRANLWNTAVPPPIEDAERSFVTARNLRRWLGDDLGWPHPYVPITEGGSLRKVVARASVADSLARIFVESLDRARA